jgi:CHAT domain-containing protein
VSLRLVCRPEVMPGRVSGSPPAVEDEATAELMQRFYRHLRTGKANGEAPRAAQLELSRRPLRVPDGRGGWTERNAASPYFWAALQLVGDGR